MNQPNDSLKSKQKGIGHTHLSSQAQGMWILVCIQVSTQPCLSSCWTEKGRGSAENRIIIFGVHPHPHPILRPGPAF